MDDKRAARRTADRAASTLTHVPASFPLELVLKIISLIPRSEHEAALNTYSSSWSDEEGLHDLEDDNVAHRYATREVVGPLASVKGV